MIQCPFPRLALPPTPSHPISNLAEKLWFILSTQISDDLLFEAFTDLSRGIYIHLSSLEASSVIIEGLSLT